MFKVTSGAQQSRKNNLYCVLVECCVFKSPLKIVNYQYVHWQIRTYTV